LLPSAGWLSWCVLSCSWRDDRCHLTVLSSR
jgi:hypothetical protein